VTTRGDVTSIRRTKINRAVIGVIAVAGILAVGLIAPNVLGVVGKMVLRNRAQREQTVQKSLTKLIKRGYVRLEGGHARLTRKGEILAASMGEGTTLIKQPKKWDGKWRVLIFDIPERRRRTRTQVRTTLMNLGFKRLQDSVWVYPYDCEELITLFKVDMKIGKDLLYMVVDKLELDGHLKTHFGV
jgi:DNA-binding transcriptional regulator PaaX